MTPIYLASVKLLPALYLANRQRSYRAWADLCRNILWQLIHWETLTVALGGEGCEISFFLLEGGRPIALRIATEAGWMTLEGVGGTHLCQEVSYSHTPDKDWVRVIISLQNYKSPLSCLLDLFSPALHSGSTSTLPAPVPSIWRVRRNQLLQLRSGSASEDLLLSVSVNIICTTHKHLARNTLSGGKEKGAGERWYARYKQMSMDSAGQTT